MRHSKLSRRTVLRAAAILGAYMAAPKVPDAFARTGDGYAPFADVAFNPGETRTIAIVGAGVAGLSAAYFAAKAGFRVAVYEGDDRYGGRSLTVRPTDAGYRNWWFDKYNPHRLFERMYVSSYQERADSPDNAVQEANFVVEPWPGTNQPVELFLNAGPGRIPSNHKVLIDLCAEVGVRLEPYIFLSNSNLLWSKDYKGEQPVQWREINFSMMGDLAQILYEAVKDGMVLSGHEQGQAEDIVLNFLKEFGDLNADGKFVGSSTVGYMQQPGGWQRPWSVNEPVSLEEILTSGFVGTGDPEQSAGSFLFNPNHILWQPTLMQPIGGMDRIWQQLLLQEIPAQALAYDAGSGISAPDFAERDANSELAGKRFVGDLVHLSHRCSDISNQAGGTVLLSFASGASPAQAHYGIVTAAPNLLGGWDYAPTSGSHGYQIPIPADMKITSNLPAAFKDNLAQVQMTPACKVGFQGKYRFWEVEDDIYGGISWTTKISSQIWYPSEDFTAPTGILTGAYNRGDQGWEFGLLGQQERIVAALDGGATLHENYAEKVYADDGLTIAWSFMPGQIAGWAAETYASQCQVYKEITTLPQGNIFFAGDTYSETPGWQEGAVDTARLAIRSILSGLPSTDPALYGTDTTLSCPVDAAN